MDGGDTDIYSNFGLRKAAKKQVPSYLTHNTWSLGCEKQAHVYFGYSSSNTSTTSGAHSPLLCFLPPSQLLCYYLRLSLLSPSYSRRSSDSGSHSRLFYPLPSTVRAYHLHCEKFRPSFSAVELRL